MATVDYCAQYTEAYFAKQVAELEASGFRFATEEDADEAMAEAEGNWEDGGCSFQGGGW